MTTEARFMIDYETNRLTLSRQCIMEAPSPQDALRRFRDRSRNRHAVRMRDAGTGVLVWHRRCGYVDRLEGATVGYDEGQRILPAWGAGELVAFLDRSSEHGVYASGHRVFATSDSSSGQDHDLRATVSFSSVFRLVEEGRLRMVPVLFQSYWMYEQAMEARPGDSAFLPEGVPTIGIKAAMRLSW